MTAEKATAGRDATSVRTLSRLRDVGRTLSSPDDDIRGRLVRDEDGRNLGRIKGLLIDDVAREIRFMEVASGGFLGLGKRTSFIPVSAITRVTETDVSISRSERARGRRVPLRPGCCRRRPGLRREHVPVSRRPRVSGIVPGHEGLHPGDEAQSPPEAIRRMTGRPIR